jgi:hypothetical protein
MDCRKAPRAAVIGNDQAAGKLHCELRVHQIVQQYGANVSQGGGDEARGQHVLSGTRCATHEVLGMQCQQRVLLTSIHQFLQELVDAMKAAQYIGVAVASLLYDSF